MTTHISMDDLILEAIKKENDTLRALLAYGSDRCVYCGISKEDMSKCQSGFPGCARADDMLVYGDNPWDEVCTTT